MSMMKVIGITGPTGAGKTTALNALKELGGHIVDCDAVYHELLRSSQPMLAELRERFGAGVFGADGIRILPEQYPALLIILPVGGFLTLACLIAFTQWLNRRLAEKAERKEAAK